MNRGESFRRIIVNYQFDILKFQFLKSFRQIFPINPDMICDIGFLQGLQSFEQSRFH